MKKRNLFLMFLFSILTAGIYALYWYISFQSELKRNTGEGFGGLGHFLATIFSFGIYGLIWSYKVGDRLEKQGGKNNGALYLVLNIIALGFIANLLMQSDANNLN